MKTILATSLSFALLFGSTPLAQRRDMFTVKNKRVALVIGNAAYKESPLSNPVNDAKDMAQLLRELGFEVIFKQNASQAEMKSAIREFGNNIVKCDVALFYYAGHGAQVSGENYLIPVDAVIAKEEEIEYESVNAGFVLAQMANSQNKLNIVILDACRNNPFARSFRSAASGLAQMNAPAGTIIAYATEPGSVAADGAGKNGLYTEELLKAMRSPGLKIEDVFKRVRVAVRTGSQGKQTPWESSSLEGDFFFVRPANNQTNADERINTPVAAPVAAADASSIELKFWESIEKSNNTKDFEAYIRKYPNGHFVDLANNRIKFIEDAKRVKAPNQSYSSPNPPNATAPNNNFPPNPLRFNLGHLHGLISIHEGNLSISSQGIQWEEGLAGDQKDNFGISCSDISEIKVIMREGTPSQPYAITDSESIVIDLNAKNLNQKGRKRYTLASINVLDRTTIYQLGDVLRKACPGVKITAYRNPTINLNTNHNKHHGRRPK